jgi:hypothetical protein
VKARTFGKIKHLEKIVPMWIFHAEMAVRIKNFHLKLLANPALRTKIVQAVNRYLF